MNHRAIVTGANRGLGLEVARQLVQAGVDVTTVARSETSAHEAQRGSRRAMAEDALIAGDPCV